MTIPFLNQVRTGLIMGLGIGGNSWAGFVGAVIGFVIGVTVRGSLSSSGGPTGGEVTGYSHDSRPDRLRSHRPI